MKTIQIVSLTACTILAAGIVLNSSLSTELPSTTEPPQKTTTHSAAHDKLDWPQLNHRENTPTKSNPVLADSKKQAPLNEKVARALEKFKDRTRNITAEDIAEERAKVEEHRKAALAQTPDQPIVTTFVDEHGQTFKRFEFPNGVVRYGL